MTPEEEVRLLHFPYLCSFGLKEPVFSEAHLMLCDDNTLLLLRTDNDDMLMLLHKARRGGFHVSRGDGDTDDVEVLSFHQILNIKGAT